MGARGVRQTAQGSPESFFIEADKSDRNDAKLGL
jgi:hypothetical protein